MSKYPPGLVAHLSGLLSMSPAEVEDFLTDAIEAGFLVLNGNALLPALPRGFCA